MSAVLLLHLWNCSKIIYFLFLSTNLRVKVYLFEFVTAEEAMQLELFEMKFSLTLRRPIV